MARERDRQRQIERQRQRETDKQTDTQTDRDSERYRQRQTDTDRERGNFGKYAENEHTNKGYTFIRNSEKIIKPKKNGKKIPIPPSVDIPQIKKSSAAVMLHEIFGVGGNIFVVSLEEVDVGQHEFHHRMEQFITLRDLRKRGGKREKRGIKAS